MPTPSPPDQSWLVRESLRLAKKTTFFVCAAVHTDASTLVLGGGGCLHSTTHKCVNRRFFCKHRSAPSVSADIRSCHFLFPADPVGSVFNPAMTRHLDSKELDVVSAMAESGKTAADTHTGRLLGFGLVVESLHLQWTAAAKNNVGGVCIGRVSQFCHHFCPRTSGSASGLQVSRETCWAPHPSSTELGAKSR